jgi:sigma-B regulation protein RsbU (phosphoserine phosphatase)/two-component system sensor histidine kinase ChiS
MSRVAGDLYDFMPIGERGLGVLVADVAGHGAPAALIAAMVKVAFSAQRPHARQPVRLVGELNRILCANLKRDFVTALYLYVDLEQRRLIACSAGHPGPLLLRGGSVRELEVRGVLLGRFADAAYQELAVELAVGDRLVAYTDGVVEARSPEGELYGAERLERAVVAGRDLALEAFADGLIEGARGFTRRPGREALDDDLTLVVLDVDSPNRLSSAAIG